MVVVVVVVVIAGVTILCSHREREIHVEERVGRQQKTTLREGVKMPCY